MHRLIAVGRVKKFRKSRAQATYFSREDLKYIEEKLLFHKYFDTHIRDSLKHQYSKNDYLMRLERELFDKDDIRAEYIERQRCIEAQTRSKPY